MKKDIDLIGLNEREILYKGAAEQRVKNVRHKK
jgi:hypothetical protein